MHINAAFEIRDVELAKQIVRAHPFGTLITADLRATHMCRPSDRATTAREMADQVVAFRLRAESWHAEAKLSQDKPADERARVLAGMERAGAYENRELAAAMRHLA